MSNRIVPNFLLAGSGKCGSSSIYEYLLEHPDVFLSEVKELHHFGEQNPYEIDSLNKERYLQNHEDYFSGKRKPTTLMIRDRNEYLSFFDDVDNYQIVGECSASYLYSNVAAKNIYDFNKDIKLVFIIRDPVSRAISHYKMMRRLGSITESLSEVIDKFTGYFGFSHNESDQILGYGFYAQQLKTYYDLFSRDQILVVLYDDLKKNPQNLMNEIFAFLNVSSLKFNQFEVHNKGEKQFSNKFYVKIKRVFGKKILRMLSGISFLNSFIKGYIKPMFSESFTVSEGEIKQLYSIYKDDISILESLILRKLPNWKRDT